MRIKEYRNKRAHTHKHEANIVKCNCYVCLTVVHVIKCSEHILHINLKWRPEKQQQVKKNIRNNFLFNEFDGFLLLLLENPFVQSIYSSPHLSRSIILFIAPNRIACCRRFFLGCCVNAAFDSVYFLLNDKKVLWCFLVQAIGWCVWVRCVVRATCRNKAEKINVSYRKKTASDRANFTHTQCAVPDDRERINEWTSRKIREIFVFLPSIRHSKKNTTKGLHSHLG